MKTGEASLRSKG